ncbi:MAG: alpha/beta fold hydrolase [Anaerolineae bacterium]|nr:alpha/beta fold hydrolase [Anaerolineae bacterium]
MTFDPLSQDSPKDKKFPPSMVGLEIDSHGALLNGVLYIASGENPHPTMLLLHGIPGHERNTDLAHIFRRAGWNVVVFHYRGAWGSGGVYRFTHILEDIQVVLDYFRSPDIVARHRIDPEKVIVVGHSLGGWAALMTAANGFVDSAASIAGLNMGVWGQQLVESPELARSALRDTILDVGIAPLSGLDLDNEIADIIQNHLAWNPTQHGDALSKVNLLLVAAKRDTALPVFDHHFPLLEALKNSPSVKSALLDTDHSFSDSRIALAQTLLDWLRTV